NAYAFAYQFSDNANSYSWSDGTPDATVTNTTTGVWAYGTPPPQFGTGFEIRAPADATPRTLRVYVGAYGAEGKFETWLSDGSVRGYTNSTEISNRSNGPSGVFTISNYTASAGQQLIIRWTV